MPLAEYENQYYQRLESVWIIRGDSIEAPPASASIERLFRVFTVLGVEMVLSSGPRVVFSMSSSTIEETEKQTDSPARREKW
ncbi:hypothetical protein [Erwinia pyri]|uniref:hypothetical protein n=1 Tax=Erwinia pyri TaxID=3062598 RepID=UPI003D185E61